METHRVAVVVVVVMLERAQGVGVIGHRVIHTHRYRCKDLALSKCGTVTSFISSERDREWENP